MGSVELEPDSSCYHSGTIVTVTAVPEAGWEFDNWSGDNVSSVNPLLVEVTDNVSLIAVFTELYTLTVEIDPPAGGTVVLTPDQDYYSSGDEVIAEAQANQFYGFSHWIYEAGVRIENPTTITFGEANEAIFAQFGVLEGEPVCADEYDDSYNGGCNSVPEVFQDILADQIMLAQAGTFLYSGNSYRDTDWFRFVVADDRILTFTAVGEFDIQLFLIDGTNGCGGYSILHDDAAAANDTAMVTATVGPGTYWLWAGTSAFSGWPCPQEYKAWLTAEPVIGAINYTPGRPAKEGELSNIE
jgi:hypothetical protein